MIKRVQDLRQTKSINGTDLMEVSYKLNPVNNLSGYISKSFSVDQLIEMLSSYVDGAVSDDVYSHYTYPIGTIVYSSKKFLSSDYLSGDILPLDGLQVVYDTSLSSNMLFTETSASTKVVMVKRNDIGDLFSYFDGICTNINNQNYVKEGYNISVINDYKDYDGSDLSSFQYHGEFIYGITQKWLRMPNLDNKYIRSTSRVENSNTTLSSSCPNITGQFVNGITKDDIIQYKKSDRLYAGAIRLVADDNIEYYQSDGQVSEQIYKKSLTKQTKSMNLYSMDPYNQLSGESVYTNVDDKLNPDSILFRPYIVVRKTFKQIRSIV